MIIIKSQGEIQLMREAGKVTAQILLSLHDIIKPGMKTKELDAYIEGEILRHKMIPAFKGYNGFPASACISINNEIVHGIPSEKTLKDGDIVSVDVGNIYKGYFSDAARTYPVGSVSDEAMKLIVATEQSFFEGLKFCKVGYRLSDISNAIQTRAEADGFSLVRDFVGHGIGSSMHEEPQIPNYGPKGRGPRLSVGMVFAIEPMVNQGTFEMRVLEDNWTAVTKDGKLSAHYENTVAITDGEPEILTL
ncbi:MAG: type I methionyl aminopeptidase [Eubacteriales bacterium]